MASLIEGGLTVHFVAVCCYYFWIGSPARSSFPVTESTFVAVSGLQTHSAPLRSRGHHAIQVWDESVSGVDPVNIGKFNHFSLSFFELLWQWKC